TTFEQRPRMHIKYRCACGQACVGIDQTEVAAIATLTKVNGKGSGVDQPDKFIKLWLHRANEQYLLPNPSGNTGLGRPNNHPAGLSSSQVIDGYAADQDITGMHIELANSDHPDHHFYTFMDGKMITRLPKTSSTASTTSWFSAFSAATTTSTTLGNAHDKSLYYYQSPSSKPVGFSLELRRAPAPTSGFNATPNQVSGFISNSDTLVAGFSYYDNRFYFPTFINNTHDVRNFPVEQDTTFSMPLYKIDSTRSSSPATVLDYADNNHTTDALHVIDEFNYLISAEYFDTTYYEAGLGGWEFQDGELVLYNTITQSSRIIDREYSRSDGNNISAVSLYKEPMPPSGSSEADFEAAYPFLYE
ncbi:MAG: hypothetical protein ACPGSC_08695, partial [Granulosicoccaceae bacterium]